MNTLIIAKRVIKQLQGDRRFLVLSIIAPLIIILLLVAAGKQLSDIQNWKQVNKPSMRLAAGVLMIVLGWLLILIANGTINFG